MRFGEPESRQHILARLDARNAFQTDAVDRLNRIPLNDGNRLDAIVKAVDEFQPGEVWRDTGEIHVDPREHSADQIKRDAHKCRGLHPIKHGR